MKKIKRTKLSIASEIALYLVSIMSFISVFLIFNNNGNILRMPTGLIISDRASIIGYDMWQDGMLPSVAWYWIIISLIGLSPAVIIALLGVMVRRNKSQALIISIVLLIADMLVLLCFTKTIAFLIINFLWRAIILAVLIATAKNKQKV